MAIRTREESKRAEEALRESEQRFQDVVDNTTAVVFVKDLELRYMLVNREYERRYRVQRDQIRGKTDFDIHPHDIAEAVRANDRRVIRAGEPIEFEETVPSDEGERFYVAAKFLLRDRTGNPYAVCGIATDITDRKRAENEIRQLNVSLEQRVAERTIELARSEEKFRALFEGTSQAVVLHDENGILEANPSWLRLLGYTSLDDVIGKHAVELSASIQPGGDRAEALVTKHLPNALANGSERFEWTILRRDGSELPMEVFLTRIQLAGREIIQAVCNDITVRKRAEAELRESEARLRESEARFSRAFRASPALMTIARLSDGKFVEANGAFVRWFGLDREGILGHDSWELGLWLNLDARTKFWTDLRRDGSLREVECQFRTRRGTVHTVLVSADIIEVNREPHVLGFFLDVTERKRVEAELLQTLAREKALGQLRSNFVSMVSHEFRTPLGIIQSSAEILEDYLDQLEPAEREDHLQSIRNNTRRMAATMEEVLLMGSFDAGRIEFGPAALELRTFVQCLADEVLSATGRRCPIELSLSGMPAEIQGDERLLRHIFTNLLTNAVKYSHAGRTVRFEIARVGTEMVCAIVDQGIGIPEADREWLFNAFHRGQNVNDRPGTGLGLVIVKRCVDLHRGKINVESKLGEGTAVTVRLPIFCEESSAARR
jgi:PAS domain S-box-containing protein